jgi:beta-lactamase regulating signal transducer with metallopeptidase domain
MSELGMDLQAFGRALVEGLGMLELSTALLLAAALVLDRALARRARASWRIALYAPVVLRVIVPLGWSLGLPAAAGLGTFVAPLVTLRGSGVAAAAGHAPFSYGLVAVAYLAVVALLAARAVRARARLGRQLADARPVAVPPSGAPCPVVAHAELGPMVAGLFSPRIVLPARLLAPGEEQLLACVVRHEVAHLRRRDPWLLALTQALTIVAWPVLPLWIAAGRVRHLVELACDEAAVHDADAAERLRYGHALLDVAARGMFVVAPLGAGELHFGSTLRSRIEALASQRHWPVAAQAALVFLAPAVLFVACGGSVATPEPATADHTGDYGYQFETDPAKATPAPAASASSSPTDSVGRVAPEIIQQAVHANFGRFRRCYEDGLAKNPKLAGTVTVSYVIGLDGTTSQAADKESTMPDKDVVACIVRGFGNISYPKPEGGVVTVVYPVQFSP